MELHSSFIGEEKEKCKPSPKYPGIDSREPCLSNENVTLDALLQSLPAYANDLKSNLQSALAQTELTSAQLWGTAIASAAASREPQLLAVIKIEAAAAVAPAVIEAALGASAIMGMNNIYFRFLHLVKQEHYAALPSHLRMNITRRHGARPADFELWCVAVSAIHGCGSCIQAHERQASEHGVSGGAILAAVRIASVIHAVAGVLAR